MNEPFVKISEAKTTWADMVAIHIAVARTIRHEFAGMPTVMVGGPTEAFPEYQAHGFQHWVSGTKAFIDSAGADVDFLSIHLYDTYGVEMDVNPADYHPRSGNNLDAVLDLSEAYTSARFGAPLSHLVSEYGSGFKAQGFPYRPLHDWYILRGVNSKMMQLLARPDRIVKAIPFIVDDASWYHGPGQYPWRLWWRDAKTRRLVESHLAKFYAAWAGVSGTYLRCSTDDTNVQVVAFRQPDGNLLVVLNNLLSA